MELDKLINEVKVKTEENLNLKEEQNNLQEQIDGLGTDFYCCPDCAEKVRRYSYKTCKEISEMEA